MRNPKDRIRHKLSGGFTLLETLVALTILLLAIVGPLTIAARGIQSTAGARDQITASFLAQEAVEYVRLMRDTNVLSNAPNWLSGLEDTGGINCNMDRGGSECLLDITADTVLVPVSSAVSACQPEPIGCDALLFDSATGFYNYSTGVSTVFVRSFWLNDVSGSPDEREIHVKVTWQTRQQQQEFTLRENILNWSEALLGPVVPHTGSIALVCNTSSCDDEEEEVPIIEFLEVENGYIVERKDDTDQSWMPEDFEAVVVSRNVGSSNTEWLRGRPVGIVTLENFEAWRLGLSYGSGGSQGSQFENVEILDGNHHITENYITSQIVTVGTGGPLQFLEVFEPGADVINLVRFSDLGIGPYSFIAYVETEGNIIEAEGPPLILVPAPARRVFVGGANLNNLTSEGKDLFLRSVEWVADENL
jgi:type II secretory pathway pseudopilin PulG